MSDGLSSAERFVSLLYKIVEHSDLFDFTFRLDGNKNLAITVEDEDDEFVCSVAMHDSEEEFNRAFKSLDRNIFNFHMQLARETHDHARVQAVLAKLSPEDRAVLGFPDE